MKKVLVLGGGTGLSNLLSALKNANLDITVGVVISDNGGSTGKIRSYYNIPAPGDLRKVMNSFIDDEKLKDLVEYRFDDKLEKHTIGNLILTALVDIYGTMSEAVKEYCKLFDINFKICPITNESIDLYAKMEDGSTIKGETQMADSVLKIKEVFYNQNFVVNQSIIKAIAEVDYVILSSGSLFTSILPNLIIQDVNEALKNTKAKKIYICNIMTQFGETDGYKVSNHIKTIEAHTYEGMLDYVIANNYYDISDKLKTKYKEAGSFLVEVDEENIKDKKLILKKFIQEEEYIRHNVEKIKEELTKIMKG